MIRFAIVALLGACTFRDGVPPQAQGDGGMTDGPGLDAPALPECIATWTGAPTVAGHLGTNGSTTRDDACPADQLPIGMRFTMSVGAGGEPVALATQILCGRVQRLANGTWTSTFGEMLDFPQQGTCLPPPPQGPVHQCPQGMVLVGVTGNTPGSSDYNSVKLSCRQPDQATITQVVAEDTGNFTDQLQTAQCVANQVVVSFSARQGCTQESLVVRCAPEVCQPPPP